MKFRTRQMFYRLLSPRQIMASILTVLFLLWYAFIGFAMLSTRQPADPAKLQLWLSGGMVLYAIYHAVKCAWASSQSDLELSPAESLWLSGGPLKRHSIAMYHVTELLLPTLVKSLFLSVALFVDAQYPVLLVAGVFSALLSLEVIRLAVSRISGSMGEVGQTRLRVIVTLIAVAVVAQIIARIFAGVSWGAPIPIYLFAAFKAVGSTAASDTVQWLSIPWIAGSQLAVTQKMDFLFLANLIGCLAMLPLLILGYVWIDQKCSKVVHQREVALWKSGFFEPETHESVDPTKRFSWWCHFASATSMAASLQWIDGDAAAIASRVATSVSKYRVTIWFSFLIPTGLCLSPLISPQVHDPWMFVIGGLATCTLMLAPASVRLDFRRDLKRMALLHSLPISARSMVLGQLYFPVVVTWMFQGFVLMVAGIILRPGLSNMTMWTGVLMALAVFVFAMENAVFLMYPHKERAQGVMMMVRSKLTFLGKMAFGLAGLMGIAAWAFVCESIFPREFVATTMVAGVLIATWSIALASFAMTAWVWRRWDPSYSPAERG